MFTRWSYYLNSTPHPVKAWSKVSYCCGCKSLCYFLLQFLLPFGKLLFCWQGCMLCSWRVSPALALVCAINLAAKLRKVVAGSQTSARDAHALDFGCNVGVDFRSQSEWHAVISEVAVCTASRFSWTAQPVTRQLHADTHHNRTHGYDYGYNVQLPFRMGNDVLLRTANLLVSEANKSSVVLASKHQLQVASGPPHWQQQTASSLYKSHTSAAKANCQR